MHAIIKKEIINNVVKATVVMQDKTNIRFAPDGLHIIITSLDHTAMAIIDVPKEQFDEYEIPSEVKFGLDAAALKAKLARCGKVIRFEISDKVRINSDDKVYGVALTNVDDKGKEPTPILPAKITLPLEDFKRIINDVKVVANRIKMTVKDGKASFFGKGELADDTVTLTPELANVEGNGSNIYALDYLTRMVDAVDTETAIVEYADKLPLKLTLGNVKYFLGSWVNNDQ